MSNIKIMLVEDILIAQKLTTLTLKKLGCDIDTADTGSQAIKLYNENQYDLIFMDLGLPDIDGLTVTENIRKIENDKKQQVPIVALTAHTDNDCKKACHKCGINDILEKPLTEEHAQQVIDKFIIKPNY